MLKYFFYKRVIFQTCNSHGARGWYVLLLKVYFLRNSLGIAWEDRLFHLKDKSARGGEADGDMSESSVKYRQNKLLAPSLFPSKYLQWMAQIGRPCFIHLADTMMRKSGNVMNTSFSNWKHEAKIS